MSDNCCAAIILAAGASSRLGRPKQLIRIDGETMLRRTARLAIKAGCSPVIAVLGSNLEQFRPELAGLDVHVTNNLEWSSGMASSLKCGLRAVLSIQPHCANLMILVCDQPKLNLPILNEIFEKHQSSGALITAAAYSDTNGVPAIFARAIFDQLFALEGDLGARRVIGAYGSEVASVGFVGGACDFDTIGDLRNADCD